MFRTLPLRFRHITVPLTLLRYMAYGVRWIVYVYRTRIRPLIRKVRAKALPVIVVSEMSYLLARQILEAKPVAVIGIAVSLLVLPVIIARVDFGLIALVVLLATIMHHSVIPRPFSFGGFGFSGAEMLMILVLVVAYLKRLGKKSLEPVASPLTPPLLLFYLSALVGLVVSYKEYMANPRGFFDFGPVYGAGRPLLYYSFFFAMIYGIHDKRMFRMFFNVTLGLACITALVVVLQYSLGPSVPLILGRPESAIRGLEGAEEVVRTSPPGLPLILPMLLSTLYLASVHRGKVSFRYGILAAALTFGLTLSFSRSSWSAIVFGVMALLLVSAPRVKARLLVVMATIGICGILIISGLSLVSPDRGNSLKIAVVERFQTLLTPKKTAQNTGLQARTTENRTGLRLALRHPYFGVGLGTEVISGFFKTARGGWYASSRSFFHNSYLNIWLHHGVIGLISFAWLSLAFLYRAMYLWRCADESWVKGIGLCFALNYVGLLWRSWFAMTLNHQEYEIFCAAFLWATVEVGIALHVPKSVSARSEESLASNMSPTLPGLGQEKAWVR